LTLAECFRTDKEEAALSRGLVHYISTATSAITEALYVWSM